MNVQIIDINNKEKIESYGLFCKKSQKKEEGYQNKVRWLQERFKEGLKYKLLWVSDGYKNPTSRGFIEYIPGEYTWRGIKAEGWMVIHCLWITGKIKGKGYGMKLLNEAINDALEQNLKGVAVLTSPKCSGLSKSPIFLKAKFKKVDELAPNYELLVLPFSKGTSLPKFNPILDDEIKACGKGISMIDACQCPYAQELIEPLKKCANSLNVPFHLINFKNSVDAQNNNITPYGIYGVIFNGEVISHCYPRRITDLTELIKKKSKK